MNTKFLCLAIMVVAFWVVSTSAKSCDPPSIDAPGTIIDRSIISEAQERQLLDFIADSGVAPGVAIGVVSYDRIIYMRGVGYRNLQRCEPVTPETRFYLKSTTKTLLGLAMAQLHEQDDIELDAPVTDYLPNLDLPDTLNAAQVSVRAHLIHTQPYFDAGLNYRTAFPGNLPAVDYVAHVNRYAVAGDTRFRYSNFGPIMAAHAAATKTGQSWRELIEHMVLVPAGMTRSLAAIPPFGQMATGYYRDDDLQFRPTLTKHDKQMHAAGGVVSTARDMAQLLLAQLNEGRIDGEPVFSARVITQQQAPQVQLFQRWGEIERYAYGLGLYLGDYDGNRLLHHFGGETHFSFMPERGLGIVVLTNNVGDGSVLSHRLALGMYDTLLRRDDITSRWQRRLTELRSDTRRHSQRRPDYIANLKAQDAGKPSTFDVAILPGVYRNERLGDIEIAQNGQALAMRFGVLDGELHWLGSDAWLADFALWHGPPERFVFRYANDELLLDWGGRLFSRTARP